MKRFIYKLLFFLIPLLLAAVPGFYILKSSGENYVEIESVLKSDKKYLIGYAYNEANYKYVKLKTLQIRKQHDVIALGSSRVLQFREQMFHSSFYNSGYVVSSIADYLPILKAIPKNKYPKTLIIALDQWMFNEKWDKLTVVPDESKWENSFNENASASMFLSVYSDLWKGKYSLTVSKSAMNNSAKIYKVGLNAVVNSTGFRRDGSMFYGGQIEKLLANNTKANDFNYSDTYNRIKNGNKRFEYGKTVNKKAFEKLEELLSYCKQNNIFVVGFIPPMALKVQRKLIETKKYAYMDQIYPNAKEKFNKYHFELWNCSDLSLYGSNDSETIDGFHGGELTYLKMLIFMLENKSKLNRYCDLGQLQKDETNKINRYLVYSY